MSALNWQSNFVASSSNYSEILRQVDYGYFRWVASDKKSQQTICLRVAGILRQERERRGLSMNLVAERAGLSQQMVSYVERGMRNPTLETLLRMAAALEVDLVKVLKKASGSARSKKSQYQG